MDSLTTLALSARDGNRLSLARLIRQTQTDVWRVCARLGPPGAADDVTQDVYIRMMRSLPSFRAESSARTWLLTIARRAAIDALRSHHRRERMHSLLTRSGSQGLPDESIELKAFVDELDADQREAFVMTQIIGLSYDEAATVCGCPIGTIRSRVARARTRLMDRIDSSETEATSDATNPTY